MPVDASEYKKRQKELEAKEAAKKVKKEDQNKSASKNTDQPKNTEVKPPDSYSKKTIDSLEKESIYIIEGDDPSHILYSNIFYCKMQLIKESLEYFGDIFNPGHEEAPRKLTMDELLAKTKQERELAAKKAKDIVISKSIKNKQKDLKGKNLESKLYYLDTDPNYSIKYLNQAYKEEESKYREQFSKEYDSSKTSSAPNIDTNRSVGDLVCEWYKTGKMSNGNDLFGGGMMGDLGGLDASAVTNVNGWNLAATIRFLENNTGMSSKHMCAKYVRMAMEAGGLSTAGRPTLAKDYVHYLPSIGFSHIATLGDDWTRFSFCPGDIAVMQRPNNPSAAGHICMYTGSIWISDFKQPGGPYVYRSLNGGHCGPLWIFRRSGIKGGMFVATTGMGGMANVGTAIAGWGIMSVNGLSFQITCEGWSDWTKRGGIGTPGTDATAGQQAVDRKGIITVGPGLTQYANPAIRQGVRFSAKQIMAMWSQTISNASKDILRRNPAIGKLPQGCKDMAVDCYHSGVGLWIKAGWPSVRTPQDAARACLRMPCTANGKRLQGLVDRRSGEAAICLGKRAGGGGARYTNAYYSPNAKIKSLVGK